MKIFLLSLSLSFIFIVIIRCESRPHSNENKKENNSFAKANIDSRSYNLGVIGAFAEVVDIGIKKLALSAPLKPDEMNVLIDEAQIIATKNNVEIYREVDFLVTDLFPAEITNGKHVLFIYKGLIKQDYLNLKAKKKQLVESNKYKGEARTEIARSFGKLLSYPDKRINELLKIN